MTHDHPNDHLRPIWDAACSPGDYRPEADHLQAGRAGREEPDDREALHDAAGRRFDWSPDGKTVAFISNLSGRNNLWLVPSEGGWPMQLTVSDQRQTAPTWSPDGKWIAYMSDYDGDEQWDIFLVSPKTGQVVNLTNTREIAEESPAWSPDGRYLAYMVKPKTSSVFEIDVYDTRDARREAPHDRNRQRSHERCADLVGGRQVHRLHAGASEGHGLQHIHGGGWRAREHAAHAARGRERLTAANDVSPDGKHRSDHVERRQRIRQRRTARHRDQENSLAHAGQVGDSGASFSPDGKSLLYTANVDGNIDIYLYDVATGKARVLPLPEGPELPSGGASPFTRDGSRMLYTHTGPTAPGDLWVYTLAADGEGSRISSRTRWWAACAREDMVEPSSGALSQQRRQVDDFRVRLRALQPAAQRRASGDCLRSRRSDCADHEHFQPLCAVHGQSGIPRDRAQLSRIDRIRQGISAGESCSTWVAATCRTCCRRRGLDQADRATSIRRN